MNLAQTYSPKTCQGTFSGSNALKLFYQSWYPKPFATEGAFPNVEASAEEDTQENTEDEPPLRPVCASSRSSGQTSGRASGKSLKGVLVLVHGLGEHSGRYCAVVKGLTAAGYAVYAFDNQGHGRSEGQRGHINRWQDYRDNIQSFLQLVRQQEPTAPLFLMGHSLGGLIVLDYVLRSAQSPQFQSLNLLGMVVSAPAIQPSSGTAHSSRVILARLLSGLFPRLTLKMKLSASGLSRKQEVDQEVADDPLIHPYATLRWGSETLNTIKWVKAHIDRLQLPILLTHGDADPIISPEGSREIFRQIQSPDKTLTLYPGSYPEPHNDLDADIVVADLVNWLNDLNDLNGHVSTAV
ncbi:MAG: lysophospholipase [Phormidesmis sp.]